MSLDPISHKIELNFPKKEGRRISKTTFRLKTFDKCDNTYMSPSHFGSSNIRKIRKMRSVILSRKILKYKQFYEINITKAHQTLIDYESYNGFNAFCSCFRSNSTLIDLNLSSIIIDPLLMIRLIKALEKHHTLRHLDLSNNSMSSLVYKYTFRSMKQNKNLETINFFNSSVHNDVFRELNDLLLHNKSFSGINFNFAKLGSDGIRSYLDTLSHATGIKSIKIANNTLKYPALVALSYYFSKSPKPMLEELELSYCNISVRELQLMMKNMPLWIFWRNKRNLYPHIHKLVLGGNQINGRNSIESFENMVTLIQNLYSLDLHKNKLTAFDLLLLARSFRKVQESLNLSHNRFQENFPENIDFLWHLKFLDLSSNSLTDNSINIIANSLAQNPSWVSLNLSRNSIDNKDLIVLVKSLQSNTTLISLGLAANKISDKGLQIFEETIANLSLRELDLSSNQIGLRGMIYLFPQAKKGQSFSLKQVHLDEIYYYDEAISIDSNDHGTLQVNLRFLEELSLANSIFLSDHAIKHLHTAENLQELNINGSALDDNMIHLSQFLISSKTLKTLRIRNVGLGAIKSAELAQFWNGLKECQSLETLDIAKNKLGHCIVEFVDCATRLKNLKSLDLSSNILENEHTGPLALYLKDSTIKMLDLSHNLFSYKAFEMLSKALVDNVYLTSLKLGKMHLDIMCLIPLGRFISRTPCLESLDLSENVFHSTSILELNRKDKGDLKELNFNYIKFEGLQYSILLNMMMMNPYIVKVDLEACQFVKLNLHKLVKRVAHLSFLTTLNLSNISFTDIEIAELFTRLKNHRNIEEISLRNADFRERSIKGLSKFLSNNCSLAVLDLSSNNLSRAFFQEFSNVMLENRKLAVIKLNDCQVKDDNFEVLLQMLENSLNITSLELCRNMLSYKSLTMLFSRQIRPEVQLLERLDLEGNPFTLGEMDISLGASLNFEFNCLLELNLARAFKLTPHHLIKNLFQFFSKSKYMLSLNLNDNGLNDDTLALIKDSLNREDSCLLFLSIADNRFSNVGLSQFLSSLKRNVMLLYLDLSKNVRNTDDAKILCESLQECLSVNQSLQVVDISRNLTTKYINTLLRSVFAHINRPFIFLNEQWNGIKSSQAVRVIESTQNYYEFASEKANFNPRIDNLVLQNKRLTRLDFSKAELDDDFCLFFSDNLHKMPFLEEFIFAENFNITLSGLKNIYVGLVLNKDQINLERVYFEKINTKIFLNNGIAASMMEWGKYGEEHSRCKKLLQKFSYAFFSKLITVNNKFQFSDQFFQFALPFTGYWVFIFYLLNYITAMTLSITLPITLSMECRSGHHYISHVIYSIYVFFTIIIEFAFWVYYKKKIVDYSDHEKELKREVFISDVLFLFSSAGEKFNLYLDVCFITISRSCMEIGVSNASIVIITLKFFIATVMVTKSLYKLFMAIRRKNNVAILNLITKLALIENFFLMGDIFDRYVPGNVKRFKKILGVRLKWSIFISTSILLAILKFFLEDLPQSIIQCVYIFALQQDSKGNSDWIIIVNIVKNFVSLIASFYGVVTLRPSYIEQSDFDERLSLVRLINKNTLGGKKQSILKENRANGMRKSRRATSLLQQGFNVTLIEEEMAKMKLSLSRDDFMSDPEFSEKNLKSFLEFGKIIIKGNGGKGIFITLLISQILFGLES